MRFSFSFFRYVIIFAVSFTNARPITGPGNNLPLCLSIDGSRIANKGCSFCHLTWAEVSAVFDFKESFFEVSFSVPNFESKDEVSFLTVSIAAC